VPVPFVAIFHGRDFCTSTFFLPTLLIVSGKTILILKYIVKSILPVTYQDLDVGGLALNVLQVDMELKFNIRILVEELEHYLNQCIDEVNT
jgi:hypothetical protein